MLTDVDAKKPQIGVMNKLRDDLQQKLVVKATDHKQILRKLGTSLLD